MIYQVSFVHRHIRLIIRMSSLLLSLAVWLWVTVSIPSGPLQLIRLTQGYAFLAIFFLYATLLITPLIQAFPAVPYKGMGIFARRALGQSAWYFGCLHGGLAFFGQLGGFAGLGFLSPTFLTAILLSSAALLVYTLMAATSFDRMEQWLGYTWWKRLHRVGYLAALLIVIHALLIGTHFIDLSGWIPRVVLGAVAILLLLEAKRWDTYLLTRWPGLPQVGMSMALVSSFCLLILVTAIVPQQRLISLGIHAQHIQLARDLQKTASENSAQPALPGMIGDRTKRYTVSFQHPDEVRPGLPMPLTFTVYDASNGNRVTLFQKVYEKTVHLIVVDSSLQYFDHIHPTLEDKGFTIAPIFPKEGIYHLYLDFQPVGGIEQQFAFTLSVGTVSPLAAIVPSPDTNLTKVFGSYQVTLSYPRPLKATDMAQGVRTLTFTLRDAQSQAPITTLQPYLASFGHLVMINAETFDYLHVHPANLTPPKATDRSGPTVDFLPLGLYGPIKPGMYRVFAQFNPDGHLMLADFTIRVE